uniref:Secreted protein n=1 Tax=Rhipicephalus appendiculatus TaxID=34631 RepID=A0A131YDN6_RHIAP
MTHLRGHTIHFTFLVHCLTACKRCLMRGESSLLQAGVSSHQNRPTPCNTGQNLHHKYNCPGMAYKTQRKKAHYLTVTAVSVHCFQGK